MTSALDEAGRGTSSINVNDTNLNVNTTYDSFVDSDLTNNHVDTSTSTRENNGNVRYKKLQNQCTASTHASKMSITSGMD